MATLTQCQNKPKAAAGEKQMPPAPFYKAPHLFIRLSSFIIIPEEDRESSSYHSDGCQGVLRWDTNVWNCRREEICYSQSWERSSCHLLRWCGRREAGRSIRGGHLGNVVVYPTVRAALEGAWLLACATELGLWVETSTTFRSRHTLIEGIVANQENTPEISSLLSLAQKERRVNWDAGFAPAPGDRVKWQPLGVGTLIAFGSCCLVFIYNQCGDGQKDVHYHQFDHFQQFLVSKDFPVQESPFPQPPYSTSNTNINWGFLNLKLL